MNGSAPSGQRDVGPYFNLRPAGGWTQYLRTIDLLAKH